MSRKILGLWNMGDDSFHPLLSPKEAKNLIKEAIKAGIYSFDSAFSYKNADTLLSSALRELNIKREEIEIISKVMPVPSLEKKVDTILRRINTNYLDALLMHWPTEEKELYEALKKLERLKADGKAREIGVSNFPLSMLSKVQKDFAITIHERPLSLIWSKDIEREKELGVKIYGYAPLGMGTLVKNAYQITDKRRGLYIFKEGKEEFKNLTKKLEELSLKYKLSIAELAYSWVEAQNTEGIIFGSSKLKHLELSSFPLEVEDIKVLTLLATSLNRKAPKDNVFSHQYLI